MPKMVLVHSVVDVDGWLSFKEERSGAIGRMGGLTVVDLVAQDESNAVAVSADVSDPDAFLATLASPPAELGAAMERHGVVPPLTVYVER